MYEYWKCFELINLIDFLVSVYFSELKFSYLDPPRPMNDQIFNTKIEHVVGNI